MNDLIDLFRKYVSMGVRDIKLENEIERKLNHINLSMSLKGLPNFDFVQKFNDLCYKFISPASHQKPEYCESVFPMKIKSVRSDFKFKPKDRRKKIDQPNILDELINFDDKSSGKYKYYFRFLNMGMYCNDYSLRLVIPNDIYECPIRYSLFSDSFDPDDCDVRTFFEGNIDITKYENKTYTNNLEFLLDPVNIERFIINLSYRGPMTYYLQDCNNPTYGILPFLPSTQREDD
jgi:hypothetical protein